MKSESRLNSGGRLLVESLIQQGVDRVFCVPGESYLEVLDALVDASPQVQVISCRHEGAASFMAEAHGKLTGRPGICIVTRGPGATNASIGVHTAFQDSTPMILLVGQVGRDMMEREAFQEVDYRRMFGQFAKWVAQIDDAARVPEFIARAFSVALSGRPGPVVLALPEDMLTELATGHALAMVQPPVPYPAPSAISALNELLRQSRKPLLIVGGSGWNEVGWTDLQLLVRAWHVPVATSFRRQDLYDNRADFFVGDVGIGINPQLAERIRQADLVISLGSRLGEMASSGYTLLDIPVPAQKFVHILAGPEELGRVYQPTLAIQADLNAFVSEALHMCQRSSCDANWMSEARAQYLEFSEPHERKVALDPAIVIQTLRETLEKDAILSNGAGNYTAWAHRYFRFSAFRCELAPTSGAMGYAVPAAVAAKLCHPERQVICLAGDGCFLMTSQELATVAQLQLGIVFIIFNNGIYGTIRMHQERHYPGRVIATDLCNPDFVSYAKSFGLQASRVERTEDFEPALRAALAGNRPCLIELTVDSELITPKATLSSLRRDAMAASPPQAA